MGRKAAMYRFEGQDMTLAQVHQMVPAVSPEQLKVHILAGRNTKTAVLTYRRKSSRPASTPWSKPMHREHI